MGEKKKNEESTVWLM